MPKPAASSMFRDLARLHVRAQRAAIGCRGTSETRCIIVTEIGRADSLPMTELVARLQLDKGWVSRAVDQLVQDGLVVRRPHESDRRVVVVALSPAGRKEFRAVEACLNAQVNRVFARLKPGDLGKIASAVKLIHAAYVADAAHRAGAAPSRPAAA